MQSLDRCPECGRGVLSIYKTRRVAHTDRAKRYLKCDRCGETALEIIRAGPPRRRKKNVKKRCTNMVNRF